VGRHDVGKWSELGFRGSDDRPGSRFLGFDWLATRAGKYVSANTQCLIYAYLPFQRAGLFAGDSLLSLYDGTSLRKRWACTWKGARPLLTWDACLLALYRKT
jgi:hypothetical protein